MSVRKIFIDSDVVISSLLSKKGAAYFLLNKQKSDFVISNLSQKELVVVAKRLKIEQAKLQNLIRKRLRVVKLKKDISRVKKDFKIYTHDIDDAHIVAGATSTKASFLLTYNLKHFQKQKIKKDFGIIVLTPAQYLQYQRSVS